MLECPDCGLTLIDIDHLASYEIMKCKVCGSLLEERHYEF